MRIELLQNFADIHAYVKLLYRIFSSRCSQMPPGESLGHSLQTKNKNREPDLAGDGRCAENANGQRQTASSLAFAKNIQEPTIFLPLAKRKALALLIDCVCRPSVAPIPNAKEGRWASLTSTRKSLQVTAWLRVETPLTESKTNAWFQCV